MRSIVLSLLALLIVGCSAGGGGVAVVSVGPEGIGVFQGGQEELTPWADIRGMHVGKQLNAQTSKSYPVLYLSTDKSPNLVVASSYSERVDKKAYAGMYIGYSISSEDFQDLKNTIAACAPLAETEGVWVYKKDAETKTPPDKRTFYKRIGG